MVKNNLLFISKTANACPPAQMQREIIQSKEYWISNCCSFAATTCHAYRYCEHESLSVYNVVGVWFSRVEISFNKVWTQNNACMTSSNQPSNWNNNREKMVMVIQLVLIGPFQLILGRSKSVCLRLIRHSYLSQYCMKMYKTYIYISKFKLNIVEYTVTYLSVIALDFESWWIKLSYFFFPTRYTKYLLIILNMQVFASSAIHHFKRPRKCFCNNL
jgi:hypothetical protein